MQSLLEITSFERSKYKGTANLNTKCWKKLDSSAPKYYGRIDENPEEWITLINCNFRMAGIINKYRIYAISNCVLIAAQSHYLRYLAETAEQNRNIDDFFKELLTSGNNKLRAERVKR